MIIRRLIPLCCALFLLLPSAKVWAEKADRNKPMNIEADALRHDELKQTTVFTGNVEVTKGTIVLRGAQLSVRMDANGYQQGVITAKPGERAFFRQQRDTAPGLPQEYIEGEGETIEYDGRNDSVRLIRRAELRRYRETTLADQLQGALVVYNNHNDTFSVDGQKTATGASGSGASPSGRVRAVLTPKEQVPDGAPASPVAAPRQPQGGAQ